MDDTNTSTKPVAVFKPKLWRMLPGYMLPYLLVWGIIILIATSVEDYQPDHIGPDWDIYVRLAIAMAVITFLYAVISALVIRLELHSDQLTLRRIVWSGRIPSSSTVMLLLEDIDRQRSSERSVFSRIFGVHVLYAKSGEHLRLKRRHYSSADFRKLLEMLNIRA